MKLENIYKTATNSLDINFDSIESFCKDNGYECREVIREFAFVDREGKISPLKVTSIRKREKLSQDEVQIQNLNRENRELKYKIAKMSNEIEELKTRESNNKELWVDISTIPTFLGDTLPERLNKWLELRDKYNITIIDSQSV